MSEEPNSPSDSPPSDGTPFAVGLVLEGKYRIDRLLARGAMGAVYEGTQLLLQRRVAIKTLHAHLATDPALRRRFEREGLVASRVRHPHIVEVIDQSEHDATPFLVMEFIDGEDLGALIERVGRMSVEEALEIIVPICAAVACAHDAGVLHRDIKPQNVALSSDKRGAPQGKLVDFGLSKHVDSQDPEKLTSTKATLGTPLYMAPEAFRNPADVDARSDQYSLAVVLYECVCGEPPFVAHTLPALARLVAQGGAPPVSTRTSGVPRGFDDVLARALSVDKSQRFPSVWALGRALLPFATERVRAQWTPEFEEATARSLAGANRHARDNAAKANAKAERPDSRWAQWAIVASVLVACLAALRWTMSAPSDATDGMVRSPQSPAIDAGVVLPAQSPVDVANADAPSAAQPSVPAEGAFSDVAAQTASSDSDVATPDAPDPFGIDDGAPSDANSGRAAPSRRGRDGGRPTQNMTRPGHYSID